MVRVVVQWQNILERGITEMQVRFLPTHLGSDSKEIEDMIKKILNSLFGKKYSIDKAREEMVKEFHRNPMAFNNSNYRF